MKSDFHLEKVIALLCRGRCPDTCLTAGKGGSEETASLNLLLSWYSFCAELSPWVPRTTLSPLNPKLFQGQQQPQEEARDWPMERQKAETLHPGEGTSGPMEGMDSWRYGPPMFSQDSSSCLMAN
ncbi:hypothetical protein H8959_016196 [Pygathrix nigripes]